MRPAPGGSPADRLPSSPSLRRRGAARAAGARAAPPDLLSRAPRGLRLEPAPAATAWARSPRRPELRPAVRLRHRSARRRTCRPTSPSDWPPLDDVRRYGAVPREAVDAALATTPLRPAVAPEPAATAGPCDVAIEHRLMHAETLAYLLHQLPLRAEAPAARCRRRRRAAHAPARLVRVPAGRARARPGARGGAPFGWDNEYEAHDVDVPAFAIESHERDERRLPATSSSGGGYDERVALDRRRTGRGSERSGREHPRVLGAAPGGAGATARCSARSRCRPSWPVYVSHAEAARLRALGGLRAAHRGAVAPRRLRHARGTRALLSRGATAPPDAARTASSTSRRWDPSPVGAHPARRQRVRRGRPRRQRLGVDLARRSRPSPASSRCPSISATRPTSSTAGTSCMKGGSPRTDASLLRRSFRNWFQPHYPLRLRDASAAWSRARDDARARDRSRPRCGAELADGDPRGPRARRAAAALRVLLRRRRLGAVRGHHAAARVRPLARRAARCCERHAARSSPSALPRAARGRRAGQRQRARRRARCSRRWRAAARSRYRPIDISAAALARLPARAGGVAGRRPCGRFEAHAPRRACAAAAARARPDSTLLVLFLGSNIGNFERAAAAAFLRERARARCSRATRCCSATDLVKPEPAAARRLRRRRSASPPPSTATLLARINRELGARLRPRGLRAPGASTTADARRVEMHLVATAPQRGARARPRPRAPARARARRSGPSRATSSCPASCARMGEQSGFSSGRRVDRRRSGRSR